MGFVNWLMKGIGFEGDENDELDDERALEKRRRKEEKKREKLARKQEKQAEALLRKQKDDSRESYSQPKNLSETSSIGDAGMPNYSYNPDGYNMQPSSYSNEYGANSMNGYGSKNVVFYKPTSYSEVQKLIDYLKQGESVMLNLDDVNDTEAQRMLDFSSGAVYALNGSVQRVQGNVFLLTPEGLNIVMQNQHNNPGE